jgi:hypothetical protein
MSGLNLARMPDLPLADTIFIDQSGITAPLESHGILAKHPMIVEGLQIDHGGNAT